MDKRRFVKAAVAAAAVAGVASFAAPASAQQVIRLTLASSHPANPPCDARRPRTTCALWIAASTLSRLRMTPGSASSRSRSLAP